MKFLKYIAIIFILPFISCDSAEEERFEEAKLLHNEAMAIFSDTRPLLKELTDARRELMLRTGISIADSVTNFDTNVLDTTLYNDTTRIRQGDTQATGQNPTQQYVDSDTAQAIQGEGIMENIPKFSDTTAVREVIAALHNLDRAQNDLLLWMRHIYRVPGYKGIYEDEKTSADAAIQKDDDSRMLLTDMQWIEMPEDATAEEVYQAQEEMKEEILRIQTEIKLAIKNAREAYIKYN